MMISNKYEVLAEIGRGGMGIVYKVRHSSLDTVSALKILPPHLATDQDLVARFHREARVMAQLRHPGIVQVVDVDKSDELHYFVMEYVEGPSLSHLIDKEGPRTLEQTVDIAIQVAQALAYAHGRRPQVIHRDIKPSNILIEAQSGRAVVTDFGLAKLAGGAESIRTESGQFLGTLRYCAPEQLLGKPQIDARVDVYALGMVMYEAYVGRSAYVHLEQPQIIAGLLQLTGEHPFEFPSDAPPELRKLIAHATAKDRDRRYGSVTDMLADLERLRSIVAQQPRAALTVARSTAGTLSLQKPNGAPSQARRIAFGATASVAISVAVAVAVRTRLASRADESPSRSPVTRTDGQPGSGSGATKPEPESARRYISVMDFTPGLPDSSFTWMRDAIRDNLNSRLSASPDCKVFSKEFIDFKAQQLVREGQYQDVRAATMGVAQKLGVTKAILGSFRADHDLLRIEAHVVDMETGVQEASEAVEGTPTDFANLQKSLANKLMVRLGVTPPAPETGAVQAADSGADLDNYRLLMQAEGQASTTEPTPAPKSGKKDDRRGAADRLDDAADRIAVAVLGALDAGPVVALDTVETPSSPEGEIRATLERYRRACEQKDLDALRDVYEDLSPAQVDANRRYFANAKNLEVSIEEVDIALGADRAAVSYTRKDRFIDSETNQPTKVEVRLTKILVRVDGDWKMISGPTKK